MALVIYLAIQWKGRHQGGSWGERGGDARGRDEQLGLDSGQRPRVGGHSPQPRQRKRFRMRRFRRWPVTAM